MAHAGDDRNDLVPEAAEESLIRRRGVLPRGGDLHDQPSGVDLQRSGPVLGPALQDAPKITGKAAGKLDSPQWWPLAWGADPRTVHNVPRQAPPKDHERVSDRDLAHLRERLGREHPSLRGSGDCRATRRQGSELIEVDLLRFGQVDERVAVAQLALLAVAQDPFAEQAPGPDFPGVLKQRRWEFPARVPPPDVDIGLRLDVLDIFDASPVGQLGPGVNSSHSVLNGGRPGCLFKDPSCHPHAHVLWVLRHA